MYSNKASAPRFFPQGYKPIENKTRAVRDCKDLAEGEWIMMLRVKKGNYSWESAQVLKVRATDIIPNIVFVFSSDRTEHCRLLNTRMLFDKITKPDLGLQIAATIASSSSSSAKITNTPSTATAFLAGFSQLPTIPYANLASVTTAPTTPLYLEELFNADSASSTSPTTQELLLLLESETDPIAVASKFQNLNILMKQATRAIDDMYVTTKTEDIAIAREKHTQLYAQIISERNQIVTMSGENDFTAAFNRFRLVSPIDFNETLSYFKKMYEVMTESVSVQTTPESSQVGPSSSSMYGASPAYRNLNTRW